LEIWSPELLLALTAVALAAGFVDSIAGGGGLLALPALLATGMPPVQALATNKLQGSFGTLAASLNFLHKGSIDLPKLWPAIACTFLGSAAGTLAVQALEPGLLQRLIPLLLAAFAVYFLFSPRVGDLDARQRLPDFGFALVIGTGVGFYDGFFGPGTGSFFAFAFVALLGHNLRRATASTKVLNFTSNIASLLLFAGAGQVMWLPGLCMGLGQVSGAWLGSHLALRHGSALIRPMLALVSLGITAKLLFAEGGWFG
jgi:uncharacterized membrane protein YfcA